MDKDIKTIASELKFANIAYQDSLVDGLGTERHRQRLLNIALTYMPDIVEGLNELAQLRERVKALEAALDDADKEIVELRGATAKKTSKKDG